MKMVSMKSKNQEVEYGQRYKNMRNYRINNQTNF